MRRSGGVVSALGKGIVAASLGRLLKARGLQVRAQKFDPYLNVDPGTMSPYQHGEVFVTDDGAETDLDLGHYERFTGARMTRDNNITTGKAGYGADVRLPSMLTAVIAKPPVYAAKLKSVDDGAAKVALLGQTVSQNLFGDADPSRAGRPQRLHLVARHARQPRASRRRRPPPSR